MNMTICPVVRVALLSLLCCVLGVYAAPVEVKAHKERARSHTSVAIGVSGPQLIHRQAGEDADAPLAAEPQRSTVSPFMRREVQAENALSHSAKGLVQAAEHELEANTTAVVSRRRRGIGAGSRIGLYRMQSQGRFIHMSVDGVVSVRQISRLRVVMDALEAFTVVDGSDGKIAFYHAQSQRYLRMMPDRQMGSSPQLPGGFSPPANWSDVEFTVVEAGLGLAAGTLHDADDDDDDDDDDLALTATRRRRRAAAAGGSPIEDELPSLSQTGVERGTRTIALHNAKYNQFVSMTGEFHMSASVPNSPDLLPAGWGWERFHYTYAYTPDSDIPFGPIYPLAHAGYSGGRTAGAKDVSHSANHHHRRRETTGGHWISKDHEFSPSNNQDFDRKETQPRIRENATNNSNNSNTTNGTRSDAARSGLAVSLLILSALAAIQAAS